MLAKVMAVALIFIPAGLAGDPFFVTYTAHMEEKGELEIEFRNVTGKPGENNRFLGSALEFEYGVASRWTSSVYLDGQSTANQSTFLTGYRWENRFRPSPRVHWINPVLYIEYENVNEASRALLEVVGNDGVADLNVPVDQSRRAVRREFDAKLILDSSFKGWTLAENFITEKGVTRGPYEFGYAVGIYRGLNNASSPGRCIFCRSNIQAGVEMYGGLGTSQSFGLRDTSHYVGPAIGWTLSRGVMFKISPNFGLTDTSVPILLRFGVVVEVEDFGDAVKKLFR